MDTPIIVTREDMAKFLASMGAPGKNREAKLKAIQALEKQNSQGIALEQTLETYLEY